MLSLPLKKKSDGIESHGSVALTDLSLFVLGVWEHFFSNLDKGLETSHWALATSCFLTHVSADG